MADKKLAVSVFLKGFDSLSGPIKMIAGVSDDARTKIRNLTDAARAQKGELADLRDQMQRASGNVTEMVDREKRLAAQLERTTKRIDLEKAAQKRLQQAREDADKARDAGEKNLKAGALLAAPLILAGKAAADFQDGMTDIRQKADLSAAATQQLENRIMGAARAAGQMPEEMRKGVDFLAGAGLDTDRSIAMMQPIGRAATAYRAQIEDLSKASFSAVDNLKVPFQQTGLAIDMMAKAGKDGNFELQDMAMYFPQLTAAAQGLGQHGVGAVADLAAALQIARKGAGDSASAANNVQNLLAKINSNETIANFKKFGVDLPAALKKAYADGKTPLEAIADLTQKTTKGDLSQIPKLFNDMQVQNALRPLIQNMAEYRQIRADAMNAAGTVDDDFAIRSQNASAQARILAGDVQHVGVVLGEQLLPQVTAITGPIANLADGVVKWADTHKTAAGFLMQAIVGIAAFNLALGGTRLAISGLLGPMAAIKNGLAWVRGFGIAAGVVEAEAPLLVGALGSIGAAGTAFGETMAAAGAFMLANPIILGITAIVAVLAFAAPWIIKHWGAISAGAMAFGRSLIDSFQPVIRPVMGIVHFLGGVWNRLEPMFATGVRLLMTAFLNFTPLGLIIKGLSPVFNWLKTIDWPALGKFMIKGIIDGVWFMMGPLGAVFHKAVDAGVKAFKDKAQIHSPSRVFFGFGQNIAEGLRLGIAGGQDGAVHQTRRMAAGVAGAMALVGAPALPAMAAPGIDPPPGIVRMATMPLPPVRLPSLPAELPPPPSTPGAPTRAPVKAVIVHAPAPSPAPYFRPTDRPPPPPAAGPVTYNITIHVHAAPGQNAQDVARAVRDELARHAADQRAAARSRLSDNED